MPSFLFSIELDRNILIVLIFGNNRLCQSIEFESASEFENSSFFGKDRTDGRIESYTPFRVPVVDIVKCWFAIRFRWRGGRAGYP